ncbi:ArsR family transcriptional regulator [Streptomyces sp. RKND-216]|nr:ArsR family transcriptional regulator [Streptomyces sp. RKND-216]
MPLVHVVRPEQKDAGGRRHAPPARPGAAAVPPFRTPRRTPVTAPEARSAVSVRLVQQRLEVLAHPARMRLARFLARAPYTTGELAESMGISAPEVFRHLTQMRKVGLLTTRRRGRYVLHQLDLRVVVRLGADYLEGVLR